MARRGRPQPKIELSDAERTELRRFARRARTNRHLALRAKIIVRACGGDTNVRIAAKLRCGESTVRTWRKRFLERRAQGLYEEPRPGAPRTICDEQVEEIIVQTLESKPKGRTHWSTRKMAEMAGVSHWTVGRIWRTFGL